MSALLAWSTALPWLLLLAATAWVVCSLRRNAGLVDIFWPLFLLLAALVHFIDTTPPRAPHTQLVLLLTAAWALRLSLHLARRNWNAPEDRRYRTIRARNEPGFWWKSLYLVFGLQALLAFVVSAPLYAAITAPAITLPTLAWAGVALALAGVLFEAIADRQLAAFMAVPQNHGRVMDQGLWRYSRHPNYFGEFCVWSGLFLVAAAAGGWWTIISPLLMSVLLLRISGVTLLERDIAHRRPGYAAYAARTNAFVPGPPRRTA
jgi:steroid 5-alpha reductase family enzyme